MDAEEFRMIGEAAAEIERLRAVIKSAPVHASCDCQWCTWYRAITDEQKAA
jgi:hypothetical protein